jgi:hypothetical protein
MTAKKATAAAETKSNCKGEIQGFFAALRMTGNSKGNSNGSGNE